MSIYLSVTLVSHHAGYHEVDKLSVLSPAEVGDDVHCSHVGQQSPLLDRDTHRERERETESQCHNIMEKEKEAEFRVCEEVREQGFGEYT